MNNIKWVIDIGNITWPLMGCIISTFVFILIKNRLFPNIKFTKGNASLESSDIHVNGGKNTIQNVKCDRHNEIDESMDALIEQRYQTEKSITSAQVRAAFGRYDAFCNCIPTLDPVTKNSLWWSFIWSMNLAAIENHILKHVNENLVDEEYISDKTLPIIKCYNSFKDQNIPDVWSVEQKFRLIVIDTLMEFSRISYDEWKVFVTSVRSLSGVIYDSHPALAKRIDRILIGVGLPHEDRNIKGE